MSELLAGEKHDGESPRALAACNDYLLMGPGRSLENLRQNYGKSTVGKPPTKHLRTLEIWSSKYGWVDRATAYDAAAVAAEAAKVEEERARIRTEGLAADYERIRKLGELAALLFAELYQATEGVEETSLRYRPKLWLRDVKQIGGGEDATLEEVFRYNSALVGDVRGVLDDLAKETGGRKQRSETSNLNIDMSALNDDQLQRIANGEDPYRVLASA